MKKKLLFLLVGLWCSWSGAQASFQAQQRISLNLRQATAEQVLNNLKGSTGYEFFYRVDDLTDVPVRDYLFADATIQQVMGRIAEGTPVSWSVRDNTVTISRRANAQAPVSRVVSGRVIDHDGAPLIGATVMITGTRRGAITDGNGHFEFDGIPGNSANLTVSYLGYITREVAVNVGQTVTIALEAATEEIEEVVITGLFDRPGESFTGSARTLNREELQRTGSVNIFQALRNLDPSLNIMDNMQYGSDPNKMPSIELRGTTSFTLEKGQDDLRRLYENDPNQPLFILNGFQVNATRVFDLDMERIENLSILKDASAKAIYGADAANGVIVIETRRSKGGETMITYRGSVDIEMPDLTSYDLTNAMEKLYIEKQSGIYDQNTNLSGWQHNNRIYNDRMNRALAGVDTDWLSKPLRTGVGTKHSLFIDLANDNLSFLGDLSYNDVAGVMKGSGRETISASMDVTYRKSNKFRFQNQMSMSSMSRQNSPWGSFADYARANPYDSPYDAYGNLIEKFISPSGDEQNNPMYNMQFNTSFTGGYFMFSDNLFVEYYPIESLRLRLRGGYETSRNHSDDFWPGKHNMFAKEEERERKGKYETATGRSDRLSADFTITHNLVIDKHLLMSNFAYRLSSIEEREVHYMAEGFPSDKMDDIMFARQYAKDEKPKGSERIVRDMAFTGFVNYIYDDRLFSDLTLRSSASSQYSPKKRWGLFWSVGVGWNMHNEEWAKSWNWLDNWKWRASIGTTGTQSVDSYAHMVTYEYITDAFYDMSDLSNGFGAKIKRLANEDLRWQQTMEYNIGFDLSLWRRLSLTLEYYIRDTKDLVVNFTLPPSTGYTTISENVGTVRNNGFDLRTNVRAIDRPNFYLNLTGMLSMNHNEITKLSDAMREFNAMQNELFQEGIDRDENGEADDPRYLPALKYEEGGSLTSIWAMKSLGIDPATGREIFVSRRTGRPTYDYSADQQMIVGNSRQKFSGNFGINGEWKGFGFNIVCYFMGGGEYYNQTLIDKVENINVNQNVDRRVFTGRWTENNPNAPYKAFRIWDERAGVWKNAPKTQATSRFVQKRNELDISAVSAYYDLSRFRAIEKMGFSRLRLGFNMNELHKFSTIKIERGTDYPFSRTMSFSLTAEF